MRLATMRLDGFKRFTNTTISDIPPSCRLIVLAGPNGSGKSSLFDGFRTWHMCNGGVGGGWDESYGTKVGAPALSWANRVALTFHDGPAANIGEGAKKAIYLRTAFRNEADFAIGSFSRLMSPLDSSRIARMIDNDQSVSENYQRLVMQTIDGVYDSSLPDTMTKGELRDRIIGDVQIAMARVFSDLKLVGIGGIGSTSGTPGTFFFDKGTSKQFLYKNLSAGEKAAFDLILDAVIKREYFDNTIWCIDEPETHLNTRVQGVLLEVLLDLLPSECQLFVASHSIGFMRKAWELYSESPGEVCFIDLQDHDFDVPVMLTPVAPSREFWTRTLDVALGDLATLVAPSHVVLCEGRPRRSPSDTRAEFDAGCYRRIFQAGHPDVDFLSVGNSLSASNDRLEVGRAIQAIASGTRLTRVIDRDQRSQAEVDELLSNGVRVLSRRHIEAYLFDDDVVESLCTVQGKPEKIHEALLVKNHAVESSVQRGNDADDMKSAAGDIYNGLRALLGLSGAGSDWQAFARDTMAPLLGPGMQAYSILEADIFGT